MPDVYLAPVTFDQLRVAFDEARQPDFGIIDADTHYSLERPRRTLLSRALPFKYALPYLCPGSSVGRAED